MRNRPPALIALLLLCVAACSAQSTLIRFAPTDSRVIAGFNLQQMKASSVGQSIFSEARGKMDPGMQKFIQTTGLDPLRDIDEILIASPGGSGKSRAVFLLRGNFDPTRFAELALQPGMTVSTFKGVQMLTSTRQQQTVSFACLSHTLIAGGDPASVRGVIAMREGSPGPDAALVARASELALAHDIWFASSMPPAELAGGMAPGKAAENPQMQMLRSIEQASGGVKLGPNLELAADLTTHTPQDAQNIAAALRLFIGLAASGNRNAKQSAALLEKLSLRADGSTVKLAFSIPEEELKKSVQAAMESARRRVEEASRQAETPAPPAEAPAPPATGVTIYSSPKDMGVVTLPPPK